MCSLPLTFLVRPAYGDAAFQKLGNKGGERRYTLGGRGSGFGII